MREFKDLRTEDIRSIKAPTLVMIGDADNVRPEHAVEMFRLLPHAQLAVLPGGHGAAIGEVSAARLEGSKVKFGIGDSKKESKLPALAAAMIEEFLDAPNARYQRKEIRDCVGHQAGGLAAPVHRSPQRRRPRCRDGACMMPTHVS